MLAAAFTRRPVWLSVLMGAGFGAAGRIAPLGAGARPVVVTMSEGFRVEAILGDAVGPDEDLPRGLRDVD